ncbi:carbohydrate porin [Sphingomonas mali]|uniref:carbohydrate porin n=1 Tax=Sphingomonas mali TaxID=40682 RepID=UPI000ADF0020|nr:carbohydrate porin [Sphingomonas mali]
MQWFLRLACGAVALAAPSVARADDTPSADLRYTTDIMGVAAGGERRGVRWMGRLDLDLDSGTDLFGVAGARAHADIFLLHGGGFSARDAGDAQVVSNIDAPYAIRPFEAWVEAPLGGGVSVKAGLIDLNSEFDVQSVGALFLNSSFGIAPDYSQSGLNGPSIFPVTSPGVLVAIERPRWTVRTAMFDAVPGDPNHPHRTLPGPFGRGGALLATEGEVKIGGGGELQLGAWYYTDRFARLDGNGRGRSAGAYVQYEQTLAGDEKTGALRGWIRAGRAAAEVNDIGLYVGGGLAWGTDDRSYGIAVAHARLGDPALRAFATALTPRRRAETAIEFTATHRLTKWLQVQPDVQYVRHPSWGAAADALVLGLRLHFAIK